MIREYTYIHHTICDLDAFTLHFTHVKVQTYLPTCLPACLPTYVHTHARTHAHTYLRIPCPTFPYIISHHIISHSMAVHYIALHYTHTCAHTHAHAQTHTHIHITYIYILHYTTLLVHYITLHCVALHRIASQCITYIHTHHILYICMWIRRQTVYILLQIPSRPWMLSLIQFRRVWYFKRSCESIHVYILLRMLEAKRSGR